MQAEQLHLTKNLINGLWIVGWPYWLAPGLAVMPRQKIVADPTYQASPLLCQ